MILKRLEKNPEAELTLPTLQAIARGGSVSEAWLISGAGVPDDTSPSFPALPGWTEALAVARRLHTDWPEWAWEKASELAPILLSGPVLPGQVVVLARTVMELSAPPIE